MGNTSGKSLFLKEGGTLLGWKNTPVHDERLELVEELAAQERSRAAICRGFGISCKNGYKWYEQYLLEGVAD